MKRIAFTVGVFDLFHEGHEDLLSLMRREADIVVVGVHDCASTYANKGRFPAQAIYHRIRNIGDTGLVDMIHEVRAADPSDRMLEIIAGLHEMFFGEAIEIEYYRGDDWKDFPGRVKLQECQIPIVFKPYFKGVSSSERRADIISV